MSTLPNFMPQKWNLQLLLLFTATDFSLGGSSPYILMPVIPVVCVTK
jgi:hypothetical protein